MKKIILLAALAACTSAGASAASLTVVCGDHAVTAVTNANNEIQGLEVDGEGYYGSPYITRQVVERQLVTFAQGFNAAGDKLATLAIAENGLTKAMLGTVTNDTKKNKVLWQSTCREVR